MTNTRAFPWFRGFLSGLILSAVAVPTAMTLAQSYPPSFQDLWEVQGDIRGCRMVIEATQAEVFDNTELYAKPANQIGTFPGGTYVFLTGVFRKFDGTTAVQVYTFNEAWFENEDTQANFRPLGAQHFPQPVGWVDARKLTPCY
ncbi:hypothetical protein [Leptolyngbya sp. BL0902]|uniref:hypothetical protein n=1 Tax=Leptolyngbya sp. BL0902 TaxID=1115757 RepID=UPI0018E805F1|nr:hypothetical protein [Leptolyngbya sp. BL0902]